MRFYKEKNFNMNTNWYGYKAEVKFMVISLYMHIVYRFAIHLGRNDLM